MPEARARPGFRRRVVRWVGAALLVLLAAQLGLYLYGAAFGIAAPTALEYGEPYIVSASWYAGTGGTLYAPVQGLPFLHNNYNPLVQLALAPVEAMTGPSYRPFRALTVLAVLGLGALLFGIVRRVTGSNAAAALGALLPLTCGFVHPWLYLGRVDAVATFFSTAAVAWAFAWREAPLRRRAWFLAFGVLAFAAKQTAVGGTAAVLLSTLLSGRIREALGLGLLYALLCGAVMGLAQALSDGQYWLHAVAYNASHERGAFWPEGLDARALGRAFGLPLLVLGAAALPLARWRHEGPWIAWLLVTAPLAFFFVRKSGSHVHYFLEAIAALSVLVAATFHRAAGAEGPRPSRAGPLLAAAAVLAALAMVRGPSRTWPSGVHGAWHQAARTRALATREDPVPASVRERIAAGPGPSLLFAKLGSLAIESGRAAIFDVADFVRLHDLGLFDPRERLIPLVEAGAFPVIALWDHPDPDASRRHFVPGSLPGLEDAIARRYRKLALELEDDFHLGRGTFWVPR